MIQRYSPLKNIIYLLINLVFLVLFAVGQANAYMRCSHVFKKENLLPTSQQGEKQLLHIQSLYSKLYQHAYQSQIESGTQKNQNPMIQDLVSQIETEIEVFFKQSGISFQKFSSNQNLLLGTLIFSGILLSQYKLDLNSNAKVYLNPWWELGVPAGVSEHSTGKIAINFQALFEKAFKITDVLSHELQHYQEQQLLNSNEMTLARLILSNDPSRQGQSSFSYDKLLSGDEAETFLKDWQLIRSKINRDQLPEGLEKLMINREKQISENLQTILQRVEKSLSNLELWIQSAKIKGLSFDIILNQKGPGFFNTSSGVIGFDPTLASYQLIEIRLPVSGDTQSYNFIGIKLPTNLKSSSQLYQYLDSYVLWAKKRLKIIRQEFSAALSN